MFVFGCVYSQAQTFTYFNKVFGNDSTSYYTFSKVLNIDNDYLVFGGTSNGIDPTIHLMLSLDSLGNTLWKTPLDSGENLIGYFTSTDGFISSDDKVLYAYSYFTESNSLTNIRIVKAEKTGEINWKKDYGTVDRQNYLRQIIETKDSSYLLLGSIKDVDNDEYTEFYIVKIHKDGEVIWEKTYAWEDGNAVATSAVETPDGGYLIAGGLQNFVGEHQLTILKLDSLGNYEWEIMKPSICRARITPFHDGSYLFSACVDEDDISKNYFLKMDTAYNIVWEKILESPYPNSGPLYSYPITNETNGFIATTLYQNDNNAWESVIIEFDSLANIIWTNTYTINFNESCYLRDIEPTPDGGYILAGAQWTGGQKGWVLKTDCMGNTCSTIGCDSTYIHLDTLNPPLCESIYPLDTSLIPPDTSTAITTIPNIVDFFQVSPNPASDKVRLYYRFKTWLPAVYWNLYDVQGKRIRKIELPLETEYWLVGLENVPSGIYFYGVESGGHVFFEGKLVVE